MTIGEINNSRIHGERISQNAVKEHGSMKIDNNGMEAGSKSAVADIMAQTLESGKDTSGEVYSKKEDKTEDRDVTAEKKSRETEDNEKNLKDIANTLTAEDYEALVEAGVVPEDMPLSEFSVAVSKLKSAEKKLEEEQNESGVQEIVEETIRSKVEKALKQKNLPVTEENISAIMNTLELTSHIAGMSDQAFAYVLDNKLEPTIENMYKAAHSAAGYFQKSYISEEAWAALSEDVKKVIEEAGEAVSGNPEKAMQDAKWLLENNIPLTAENLKYKQDLEKMRDTYSQEKAIDSLAESILGKTELSKTVMTEEAVQVQDEFFETVSVQRRLEEARLKMLRQAEAVIDENGFEIDFEEIEKNIERLKKLEDSLCGKLLTDAGLEADANNVNLFKATLDTVWEVSGFDAFVLADTFAIRTELDLDGLAEAGRASKTDRGRNAEDAYEALMTKPRRDMGDSIKKAFANIDELLGELGIETTDANRRAARILGYNSLSITEESINEMKYYDKKVTTLIDNMKPSVVLELIRENINPLTEKIDKLSEKAADIIREKAYSPEEHYADFLIECEQHRSISEQERSAYIGIHRLLYQVEKSDGAAIGALVNSGRELTLGNLLTEIRTEKHKGLDVTAGEEYVDTALETQSVNKIDEQIMQGYNDRSADYYRTVAEELFKKLTPGKLEALYEGSSEAGTALEDMSLEALLEEVNRRADKETGIAKKQHTEQIRELAARSSAEISFLESFEIPCTINNILAAGNLRKGKSLREPEKAVAELEEEEKETLFDFEKVLSEPDEFCEKLEQLESDYIERQTLSEETDSEQMNLLRMMRSEIRLAGQLRKRNVYEMPLRLGKEITKLKLTIENGRSEQGVARISVTPGDFGSIQAEIRLNGSNVGIAIFADSRKSTEALENHSAELKESFEEKGFSITGISYGIEKLQDAFIYKHGGLNYKEDGANDETKAETSEILRAVKLLLGNVNMVLPA